MYVHGFKHQFSVVRSSNAGVRLFASVCKKKGKMCVRVHTSVCVRVYMWECVCTCESVYTRRRVTIKLVNTAIDLTDWRALTGPVVACIRVRVCVRERAHARAREREQHICARAYARLVVAWLRAHACVRERKWQHARVCDYGVATISRLLKIIGLFCRISSLI